MRRGVFFFIFLLEAALFVCWTAMAQEQPPLLPEETVRAIASELSGEIAKRNLEFLARLHRQRGSHEFHTAAEFVAAQLRRYGIGDAHTEQFIADGKTMYGTQKARLPWDGQFGELWELRKENGQWVPTVRLCDFEAMPVTLAEDSADADVTTELVDAGTGTTEKDYQGRDVRGKIVLVSEQPGMAERLAVERFGAAGIVSYALNQPQAWQGENEDLVRWGHLDSFPKVPTFAFMISLKTARELQARLSRGETIRLHAAVRAGRHPGSYDVVTGTIPGADAGLKADEIVFSCHLDHERPGANDNASGCATILEVARTLQKLITQGKITRPARSIRFVWPAEIEGTLALLNSKAELVPHIRAVVHMDMVGGPQTKAIFHVTRAPASLPSFVNDVGEAFTDFVNRQSDEFTSTGQAAYPLVAPEGGKEALLGQFAEFTAGSDHDVYEDGSYRIPAIYLNDWPDRYIHTNFDSAANIDPTKLLRSGFIGAASGYFLADLKPEDVPRVMQVVEVGSLRRTATMLRRRNGLRADASSGEAASFTRFHLQYERRVLESIGSFLSLTPRQTADIERISKNLEGVVGGLPAARRETGDGETVFVRNVEPKGPMQPGFGYDYFADRYGQEGTRDVKIFHYKGPRAGGAEYAYEALNFVDGKRSVQEIRDAVSAEFGPVPLEVVAEYLHALESIGTVHRAK